MRTLTRENWCKPLLEPSCNLHDGAGHSATSRPASVHPAGSSSCCMDTAVFTGEEHDPGFNQRIYQTLLLTPHVFTVENYVAGAEPKNISCSASCLLTHITTSPSTHRQGKTKPRIPLLGCTSPCQGTSVLA